MPICTDSDLPVNAILEKENIFVMEKDKAMHQDIRPLSIAIVNLMPQEPYSKECVEEPSESVLSHDR